MIQWSACFINGIHKFQFQLAGTVDMTRQSDIMGDFEATL